MEGVQILNQFEVVTETVFSWHNFWIGFAIGAIIGLIIGIGFGVIENDWFAFLTMFIVAGLLIAVFIGVMVGKVLAPAPVSYEAHYEVSINDEVNMKDFMDKYEILGTRGDIYTVREKSND